MENASKALIMAGNVLIALMIIGALVLMFSNLTSYQDTKVRETRSEQIVEFNNQYETYNRTDVRGSDLYSLLNRATDYNMRQTISSAEGQESGFQPITIKVIIDDLSKFTADTTMGNLLITQKEYKVENTKNEFHQKVYNTVNELEEKYGQTSLTNLTTAMTRIFIQSDNMTNEPRTNEERQAVEICNNAIKKKERNYKWSDIRKINPTSTLRRDVYTYYEYIQFKRAHFNCEENATGNSGVKYDENNGRIIEMTFRYNGTIE